MILVCHDDYVLFKQKSYYLRIIEFNIHIRKNVCIYEFLHKSVSQNFLLHNSCFMKIWILIKTSYSTNGLHFATGHRHTFWLSSLFLLKFGEKYALSCKSDTPMKEIYKNLFIKNRHKVHASVNLLSLSKYKIFFLLDRSEFVCTRKPYTSNFYFKNKFMTSKTLNKFKMINLSLVFFSICRKVISYVINN